MSTIETIRSYMSSIGRGRTTPHPAVVGTGLVGIEIELENVGDVSYHSRVWDNKSDGSLRNGGREFVLCKPLGGSELLNAIVELTTVLGQYQPDTSWRCSTHVHMNIRDLTIAQLKRFLLSYIVFEKVLFKCGSLNRYKNNFCVPFNVAKSMLDVLGRHWDKEGVNFLNGVSRSWCKYSSLNLIPMWSIGSAELRIGNAEVDKDRILAMCNRLLTLKQIATSWEGEDVDFVKFLAGTPFHNIFNKSICLDFEVSQDDVSEGLINAFHVLNYKELFESQYQSGDVRFDITSRIAQGTLTELNDYILSRSGEEAFERYRNTDWTSATYQDIVFLSGVSPFGASNLLEPSDFEIFSTIARSQLLSL